MGESLPLSESKNNNVSAVIVHLGRLELLQGCMESLYRSTCIDDIECIVVDNASGTIGLDEFVLGYRGARLIRLAQRSGYPAATNAGIKASKGQYILWCNNDLLFESDAVAAMKEFLDCNPEYGVAGPRLLNPNGSYQPSFSHLNMGLKPLLVERFCLGSLLPRWDLIRHCIGKETQEQDVAVVTGACCMIRRSAIEQIGGMIDERFYMYAEEFDLCHTLSKKEWRIRYLPQARIIHLGGQTTNKTPFVFLLQACRSHYAYLLKHYGVQTELIFALCVFLGTMPRIIVVILRWFLAMIRRNNDLTNKNLDQLAFYRSLISLSMSPKRHQAAELYISQRLS